LSSARKNKKVSKEKLSRKEVSQLNYYDFKAYLGVPLFQFSGLKVAEDLIRRCGIHSGSDVLEVGCGTGFMACRISEEKNCRIVGIDISDRMIGMARERAEKFSLEDKATFRVADAKKLPFEDNSFDVVFAQFVCVLLDKKKALAEFMRVLKPGGYLGVVEIFKDILIPYEASRDIREAERILSEAIELDLRLSTPTQWKSWFTDAGVQKIQTAEHKRVAVRETLKFIKIVGILPTFKIVFRYLYHLIFNVGVRRRFLPTNRAKKILLRRGNTAKYIGVMICVGIKPAKENLVVSRGRSINL
jgi:ubiquinone/menaquinone biosynthesis C-methylase UbiE